MKKFPSCSINRFTGPSQHGVTGGGGDKNGSERNVWIGYVKNSAVPVFFSCSNTEERILIFALTWRLFLCSSAITAVCR